MTANRPRKIAPRWLRYSIRTLLVIIFILSVFFAWLAYGLHRAKHQRAAVAAITKAGGFAVYEYDYERDGNRAAMTQLPKPNAPIWLWDMLGHDFFVDIVEVGGCYAFSPTKFNDETAQYLDDLPSLKSLNLRWTRITDVGVAHIAHLKRLERLDLGGLTGVTDAALLHLTKLDNLKYLDISGTEVTDDGLPQLTALANLQELQVFCDRVTDEGIASLQKQLPHCKINAIPFPAASPVVDGEAQARDNHTSNPVDD